MAIQLDCPACFKTLRVADAAMGTVIACPKCQAKMRVPRVAIPAATAGSGFEPDPSPMFAAPPASGEASPFFAADDDDGPGPQVNPHAVLAKRNQRRMSRGWIGMILAFALATIGVTGTWWWSNRQNVVRTADAAVIANATLSKDLNAGDVNVTSADWRAMTTSLELNPVELTEAKMKVRFGSAADRLQLSLTPTSERMLVAVPTSAIAELQDPATVAALQEAWKSALSHSVGQMSKSIQEAVAAGVPARLGSYGDVVGMEGLAGPKGYHFHAAVGTTAYPCVFEDANRQLYFLVPPGTQSLAVIPRDIGARNALPEKMRITATVK
ncbi:hypothetical protein Pan44_40820 [Caulifigura coniformis]|uniref:Uncharacterized protein n=1 Tax=Caulifigura coniformis TaxID=2527983 RepID=A0A517SIU2_9PLAN|nr:hypothetical protein [Caulifigura coniformis]QDT56032.1 hypothetical protein Pan44_40820 [Caulifigura coniformis]